MIDEERALIDDIDRQITELISLRMPLSKDIQRARQSRGEALTDLAREREVMSTYTEQLGKVHGKHVATAILDFCKYGMPVPIEGETWI